MKKYLMTGIAALAMCAGFTSCSHDLSMPTQEDINQYVAQKVTDNYNRAFIDKFGQPAENQDWGFGTASNARALTRASMPSTPSFRDTYPNVKPTVSSSYKNTLADAIAAGAKYAKDYQNYQRGDIIYINSDFSSLNNPQNTENLTIYVDGNVTYWGQTNQNGNGTVFCVTNGSTLKLGAVSNNLTVYLAPNATLDITQPLQWDGSPATWTSSFTFQNPNAAIYMSAGSKVNASDLYLVNGVKMLNDGGTITANNITLDQNSTLWNEGTITVENNMTLTNTSSSFFNAQNKTVTVKGNLNLINNNALLYNEGTVNVTGAITTHNTDAEIINNGTMTAASYSQAAGGKMHNVGTATFTGKTALTNSNSKWQNDGKWTCGSFDVDNYSAVNFNNCSLTVNGNFFLNRGTFVLNNGASVVCQSFTWEDTSDFYLGGKALLSVSGTLTTNNYNSGYGFRGTGDDYAVIKANKIAKGKGNVQFSMSYFGKLLIDTNDHFAQGALDPMNNPPAQPYYYYGNDVKFTFENQSAPAGFKIDKSDCTPGYTPPTIEEEYETRILGEDLTPGDTDWDFNDVVFSVEFSGTTANCTLLAAGGTLPLRVYTVANEQNPEQNYVEVHELFGVDTNVMVNTGGISTKVDKTPTFQVTGVTPSLKGKDIIIKVNKGTTAEPVWVELTANQGEPAAKLAVTKNFKVCTERQNINTVYTKFTDWVLNPEIVWY